MAVVMLRTLLLIFCLSVSAVKADPISLVAHPQYDDAQEVYRELHHSYQEKNYKQVVYLGHRLVTYHTDSPVLANTYFYYGVALFHQGDYQRANDTLSTFLEKYALPQFFEEALHVKFAIAEKYRLGEKKRIMGMQYAPRWESSLEDAIAIYDEVILTLNREEIAIQALYHKAGLLVKNDQWKEGIDAYQTLIRRFPTHPLSASSYLAIADVYLEQSKIRHPDAQIIALAEMNYKRFCSDYPQSEQLPVAEKKLIRVKERFAKDLWDSADFFARKRHQTESAIIYYKLLVQKYPETTYAYAALKKLHEWKEKYPEAISAFLESNSLATN